MRASILSVWAVIVMLVAGPAVAASDLELTGEIAGAPYEIRVPSDWNGTLVVYAHGYRDKADHPGEIDDRSADAFVADPFEQVMLDHGYALAGSAYSDNGWAVKEGIYDTLRLVNRFRARVGDPETTILVGFSMGSVVTFESIERFPGIYDAAVPACPVGAGVPRAFDGTLAIASGFDAVFGWPGTWGTPADVRDDLDFESEVLPVLLGAFFSDGGAARFEFIRRVTGVPIGPEWPFTDFFFVTEARAELERRAKGSPVQNATHIYSLSEADRSALTAMGLTEAQIDGWLAAMNGSRVEADPGSRRYLRQYADYTGRLRRPVVTLHTVVDALVPPAHISAYNQTLAQAGSSDLVFNAWTTGFGHCNFTPAQVLTAVAVAERWAKEGVAPTEADFPAELGFTAFAPQPWPQP
ncbi:MAG: alpha/beta hydrolase [Acidimicrobiia bacterium]|nr:MAG: alpha/beta hydrolase [Acidimicrobiia bacterium]